MSMMNELFTARNNGSKRWQVKVYHNNNKYKNNTKPRNRTHEIQDRGFLGNIEPQMEMVKLTQP